MEQRSVHLGLGLTVIFLFRPSTLKGAFGVIHDSIFVLLGLAATGLIYTSHFNLLVQRAGAWNTSDMILGAAIIVLSLEATRRLVGWVMPIMGIVGLLYTFYGHLIPGFLGHSRLGLDRAISGLSFTSEGVFGPAIAVSASIIPLFLVFAALMRVMGGSDWFIEFARSLFGRVRGGPPKVAVVASSMLASISGSGTANVVATGSFTIPLMIKYGMKKEMAAAVEAVASAGGQLMPPIMGAAAFLIAEFLGLPYSTVALAAVVPSVLYYITIYVQVDLHAARMGMVGLPSSELPKLREIVPRGWVFLLAPAIMVYLLVIVQVSAQRSAFWAVVVLLVVGILQNLWFLGRIPGIDTWLEVFDESGQNIALVAGICATAGVLVGSITLTGLGMKLSTLLTVLAGGNVYALLALTALAGIILGAGLPTTAVYVILAILVAPALVAFGITPLAAHMFVFYYGIVATITPPVAITSFAAAGVAGADPMHTSVLSAKLGSAKYIVPFLVVYHPELLLRDFSPYTLMVVAVAATATLGLGVALEGYLSVQMHWIERTIMLIGVATVITPNIALGLAGAVVVLLTGALHILRNRPVRPALPSASSGTG